MYAAKIRGNVFVRCVLLLFWQVKEVIAVNGGAEGLIDLLGTSTSPELLLEVAWVICHATFSQADLNRLVHLGLIKAVMTQVNSCLQEVSRPHCMHIAMLITFLRHI